MMRQCVLWGMTQVLMAGPLFAQAVPAGAPGRQGQEGPRPYAEVITARAQSDSGVFLAHRVGDRLYFEIPQALFDREFLLIADQRGTVRGVGYGGEQVSSRIVRWERRGSRVLLRVRSYAMRADSTLPVARAVDLSNQSPILMAFDIATWNPADSAAVIEVTRLYTTDVPELGIRQGNVRVRRLDPARSVIERVKSLPRNLDVSVLQTYEVDSIPGPPGNPADRSLQSMTLLMNYSMVLLPDQPMMPRLCDARVGYFSLAYEDFGNDESPVPTRCIIQRYRLEPRDPSARVSDPVQPIVWWIDPATPAKWVPWLMRGVQAWEPVFRAAGFSNAIEARMAPTNDPDFDLDDARLSVIRWLPSTIANAFGPRISDPRTGEILNANIMFHQNAVALSERWYWSQAGASDPAARRLPLPDSLMGRMMMYIAAHEVGHSIGLRHNHIASAFYPVDSLRSRSFTCQYNTTASIMDYARVNYVAQPGDNACMFPHIGPYDFFAIDWGYRRIPGAATPDAERPTLDQLARQQEGNPYLRWLEFAPHDPRVMNEAIGNDPVRATGYGLANIRRLMANLLEATTTDPLRDYGKLNEMYGVVVQQWALEMGHVAGVVGGVHTTTKMAGQAGPVHVTVPRAAQQRALRFLLDSAFTTPTYFLDPEVLRRIEPTGVVERVRQRQTTLLGNLLQDARLSRLVEQQALATAAAPAYSIADLFGELRRGLFREAAAPAPEVDAYRRNVQRAFVDQMQRIIATPLQPAGGPGFFGAPPVPRPADAVALARAELRDLTAQLGTAVPRTTDRTTRAHFEELRARIDRILNPD